MRRRDVSGVAIAVVLGLLLVLGIFGLALSSLSSSASREVDTVTAYLRAVAIGEIAFGTVTARLAATPWNRRWFRDGPDLQYDVPATGSGGTYSYLIQDARPAASPSPPPPGMQAGRTGQADLLVRATYANTVVVMLWRLTVPADSVDGLSRVVPGFFTFGPAETPLTPAAANPLSEQVNTMIGQRENNRPGLDAVRGPLAGAAQAPAVGGVLGTDGTGVLDEVPGLGAGQPGRSNADYKPTVQAGNTRPTLPTLPGPVPGTVPVPGTSWPSWPPPLAPSPPATPSPDAPDPSAPPSTPPSCPPSPAPSPSPAADMPEPTTADQAYDQASRLWNWLANAQSQIQTADPACNDIAYAMNAALYDLANRQGAFPVGVPLQPGYSAPAGPPTQPMLDVLARAKTAAAAAKGRPCWGAGSPPAGPE